MSSKQPPLPVPLPPAEKVRSFLGWAFVISVALHLFLGPILGLYKAPREDKAEIEKVSVTHKIKVIVPTPPPPTPRPTPPPTPTPTPPPKQTPPPVHATNPPPQPKLRLHVVHTTSKSVAGPTENRYIAPAVGNENGVPQGTAATGPVSTAAPAPATPAATPKPACANPHVDATVTRPVEPDYPDIARQEGATGTVQVKVTLTAAGGVAGASVYRSSGNAALDNAAVKAAEQSSYTPEVDDCQPIAGSYLFRADFTGQ